MDSGIILVVFVLAALVMLLLILLVKSQRRGGTESVNPDMLRTVIAQAIAEQQTQPPGNVPGVDAALPPQGHPVPSASNVNGESRKGSARPSRRHAASDTPAVVSEAPGRSPRAPLPVAGSGRAPTGVLGSTRVASDATSTKPQPHASAAQRVRQDRQATDARQIAEAQIAEAQRALEAQRVSLAEERARLVEGTEALANDQQRLATERDRLRADRVDIERQRSDIATREQALRERMAAADARQIALDQARLEIDSAQSEVEQGRAALAAERAGQQLALEAELARISSLTVDEARAELLQSQEDAVRRDAAMLIRRVETEAQSTAKSRARRIVADAIQRVASDQTSQSVVSVMHLPSDELKGRIIGREGRNIRAFETVTGVNVIVDDTPEAVLLSCFDPVRREIGRVTLQALIDDGRIHPHRIEEAYERAQEEVEGLCARAAEDALLEVGVTDVHPELVSLIGQLKYRTSYGQNVLGHLIETSHIARLMAAELGIDPAITARGAFLHDVGKALTHEAQGSHAIVGAEVARKFGESAEVVHCIEAHHDEVPPSTVEAVLTQAADACSGGRPGARRESLESYVKRLEHIEAIASAKKGVDKVFAMQAGRELRVMVKPDLVDDLEAHVMAREVAKQIEEELTYPGQVRVTVIRESRATEVAR